MTKEEHHDTIGWLINSFFLIFLANIFSLFVELKDNSSNKWSLLFIAIIAMFFGLISLRLFLRTQKRRKKALYPNEPRRWEFDTSIKIYVFFISLVEMLMCYMISPILSSMNLILIIIILIVSIICIIIETRKMRVD